MQLWLIAAIDADNNNLDLFVWAPSVEQAYQLWKDYFQHNPSVAVTVYTVPLTPPPNAKALQWGSEVVAVWQTEPEIHAAR